VTDVVIGSHDVVQQVMAKLWPPPARVTTNRWGTFRTRAEHVAFLPLPSLQRPRLLVPMAQPRAAAAAVRLYRRHAGMEKFVSSILAAGLGSRVAGGVLRSRVSVSGPVGSEADTILGYLRRHVAADAVVSIYLGVPRGNQKPVLHIFRPDGELIAVAKIGVNPLTRQLARAEGAALERISQERLRTVIVPRVLHRGQWQDCEILVQSPVPMWQPTARNACEQRVAAMVEVCQLEGTRVQPLGPSSYLTTLLGRARGLPQGSESADLLALLHEVQRRFGREPLSFGCWHGDWSAANIATTEAGVLVWDWERFGTDVPCGFDALHWSIHEPVAREGAQPVQAIRRSAAERDRLLAPFDIAPRHSALVFLLYLADMACRYLGDGHARVPRGQRMVTGLLSELNGFMTEVDATRSHLEEPA
jgi:hypothetical protein